MHTIPEYGFWKLHHTPAQISAVDEWNCRRIEADSTIYRDTGRSLPAGQRDLSDMLTRCCPSVCCVQVEVRGLACAEMLEIGMVCHLGRRHPADHIRAAYARLITASAITESYLFDCLFIREKGPEYKLPAPVITCRCREVEFHGPPQSTQE